MASRKAKSVTVLQADVDPAEVLADIAVLTKILRQLESHPELLSPADRQRLQELADLVTVGELTRALAVRRAVWRAGDGDA